MGEAWSRTEEFGDLVPAEELAGVVLELAQLAQRAVGHDEFTYYWLCVEVFGHPGLKHAKVAEAAAFRH